MINQSRIAMQDGELTKQSLDLKEGFDFFHLPHPELPDDHPDNRLAGWHNVWLDDQVRLAGGLAGWLGGWLAGWLATQQGAPAGSPSRHPSKPPQLVATAGRHCSPLGRPAGAHGQ